MLLSNGHRILPKGPQRHLIADVRLGEGLLGGSLEIHAPDRAVAALGLDLHEVGHGLARVVAVRRAPVIDQPAGEQLFARRRWRVSRQRRRGAWRHGVFGRHTLAPNRARNPSLLELTRPVAAYLDPLQLRGEPDFLAEALGAADRDLAPTARFGDRDQALHDLRVLARRSEARPSIGE